MAPPIVFAVKLKVVPTQTGLLLAAVGADGVWLIVTTVVADDPVQPATVTATEYAPEANVVTFPIVGFCKEEEKLFGPVQE